MPYFTFTQFNLGSITIYTWGLMVGLGFFLGYLLALFKGKKKGIEENKILILTVLIFLFSIVFARLFSLLFFEIHGFMFYGGLFGAVLIGLYYLRNKKEFLKLADLFAPSVALGIFFGRMGCFFIKDHPGTITNLPWGILWPDGIVRHPVALYLSVNGLILFLILWFLRDRFQKPGYLFLIFLTYYSISRFFLEFFRYGDPRYLNLTSSQWIGLIIILGVFVFLQKDNRT